MRFAARSRVLTSLVLMTGPPATLLWIAVEAMAPPRPGSVPLATTPADFFQGGTQPEPDPGFFDPILSAVECSLCHANYDPQAEPYTAWAASMMGQSARDPLFYACLSIANQDAANAGGFCVRCHAPNAYLSAVSAESVPNDGSAFGPLDFDSINCNFCHRLVDPEYKAGVSPPQDEAILDDLDLQGLIPPQGSNSRFVVDPVDSRRGPFDDVPVNMHVPVEILVSPFHTASEFCWNCHDVSNPLFV